ncbi:MAG: hypothetical protein NT099_07020 [Candidatus Saganbacteria bacterium]|nr:hypothetical protein [Candidatus Saganbacteria bacterium]
MNMGKLIGVLLNRLRLYAYYLLPVKIRLQKGFPVKVDEKKKIVRKLHATSQSQPLFAGKRVLCWEPAPWPIHIALISAFGTALSLRGAQVEMVICGGTRSACIGREITDKESVPNWSKKCANCYKVCKDEADSFDMKNESIADLVDSAKLLELRKIALSIDFASIRSYSYKGVDVGAYTLSSVTRYYKGKVKEFEEYLLREYLFSALVITEAAINKITSFKPDVIYMSHAIYVSWGPVVQVANKKGIPVIKIGGAYKKQYASFLKIKGTSISTSYGALSDHGWEKRLKKQLSSLEEQRLDNYFRDRYVSDSGDFCDIRQLSHFKSKHELFNKLNITTNKPVWCVFTHLNWDSSLYESSMAFRDFNEWIIETLKIIMDVSDVQWLIKIHPAEKMHGTVEGIEKIIDIYCSRLPNHIKIIPPDTDINTYNLLNVITGGVTCLGTVGLELAAMGKPVIVAAKAYYSQKGFTYDGLTPDQYESLIRKTPEIPPFLTSEQKDNARKFAYSYFIQRQIPLRMFKIGNDGNFESFDWRKVELFVPGADPIVDMICERFFEGEDLTLNDDMINELERSGN